MFAGSPQIADPQSLIFSPFFLIAAALVPEPSFVLEDAIVFAMLAMGGLALMAYFRDRGMDASRRADRRFRLRLRRLGRLAHSAHGPDHEPRLVPGRRCGCSPARSTAARPPMARRRGIVAAFLVLGRDQVAFLGC